MKDALSVTQFKVINFNFESCVHATQLTELLHTIINEHCFMIAVQIKGYWDDYLEYSRVLQGEGKKAIMDVPKPLWKAIPHQSVCHSLKSKTQCHDK